MAEVEQEREQYENTTGGYVGACQIDRRGDRRWIAVAPDERVWLSEEERIATANAPRQASDNPFIEREEDEKDDDGNVLRTVKLAPALNKVSEARPIASNRPIAPQGSYSEHEEVAIPVAR